MNLIIVAGITEPPTETLPLRDLTAKSKLDLSLDVLIETHRYDKDGYFYYLRDRGLLDYVEELITDEEREDGIRIDTELNYPRTIVANYIDLCNFWKIYSKINGLRRIR